MMQTKPSRWEVIKPSPCGRPRPDGVTIYRRRRTPEYRSDTTPHGGRPRPRRSVQDTGVEAARTCVVEGTIPLVPVGARRSYVRSRSIDNGWTGARLRHRVRNSMQTDNGGRKSARFRHRRVHLRRSSELRLTWEDAAIGDTDETPTPQPLRFDWNNGRAPGGSNRFGAG